MKTRFLYVAALLAAFAFAGSTGSVLSQDAAISLPPVESDELVAQEGSEFVSAEAPKSTSLEERFQELEKRFKAQQEQLQKLQSAKTEPPKSNDYVVGSDTSLAAKWTNDGATLQSSGGDFRYRIRGFSQLDFIGLGTPSKGVATPGGAGTQDSVNFRRLRLGAEGTMYETIDWVFEFDFAFALQNVDPTTGSSPSLGLQNVGGLGQPGNVINLIQPTTTYLNFKALPIIGNIRIGNQQSWYSMEHIESARFLDFMERSPLMDAFSGANNNGYTPGISVFNTTENKKAAWQVGAYKNNVYDSGFAYEVGNNNYTYGSRATWTPYYDELTNGRYLVHLGMGGEFRTFNTELSAFQQGTNVRIRTRGDLRNTPSQLDPNFADTGNFFTSSQSLFCPEFAVNWGPWLLRGEYQHVTMNGAAVKLGGPGLGKVAFNGAYLELMYFLTGENRDYNRVSGVFNRIIPYENAYFTGLHSYGLGAWQVGARYDWLDLNSGGVQGGVSQNLTLGLNWFLNPNAKFQFNYVNAYVNNNGVGNVPVNATGSLIGSRFGGIGYINSIGARMDFNF